MSQPQHNPFQQQAQQQAQAAPPQPATPPTTAPQWTRPNGTQQAGQPAQNGQQQPAQQGGGLLSRARANNTGPERMTSSILPLEKTVIRFDVDGLGDPFYRLLGKDLNVEFGEGKLLAQALEQGGELVSALTEKLDATWASYNLQGALLVYRWNVNAWKSVAAPVSMPLLDQDEDDLATPDDANKPPVPTKPAFTCLRAIDVALVLNVLARSRMQMLLANAPLVFNQQYLNRGLFTDDPRLVTLARATGCLTEQV